MSDKIVTLEEAVKEINNGDIVAFGGVLDSRFPMAAVYEIMRQEKKNLVTLSIMSLHDPAVGAGCIRGFIGCYNYLGAFGKAPCIEREYNRGNLVIEDLGHNDSLLILMAPAFGLSFVASDYTRGSDILNPKYSGLDKIREFVRNKEKIPEKKYVLAEDPFTRERVHRVLLPGIKPDVAIIHVQQVGMEGTCRVFGVEGVDQFAAFAADKVIVTAEEIVPEEYLREDPNRNMLPSTVVDRIVPLPWGAHPTVVSHYYELDAEFIMEYAMAARTEEGFRKWAEEWVYGVDDHFQYLRKLGVDRLQSLRTVKGLGFRPRAWPKWG
ncbi:CoA transferase subunit A [Archaeoglobus neptunius]|uniref:CoA transferase subunit A n=1 Tax=Archaeoglobus neptunius TaxID=2798580 RepID=UPI001927E994|nr:CoA transferase subunit A [Archaeoglobus neptunius]